ILDKLFNLLDWDLIDLFHLQDYKLDNINKYISQIPDYKIKEMIKIGYKFNEDCWLKIITDKNLDSDLFENNEEIKKIINKKKNNNKNKKKFMVRSKFRSRYRILRQYCYNGNLIKKINNYEDNLIKIVKIYLIDVPKIKILEKIIKNAIEILYLGNCF